MSLADPFSSCLPLLHEGMQKQPRACTAGTAACLPVYVLSAAACHCCIGQGMHSTHFCLQHPLKESQRSHTIARTVLLLPLLQQLRCLQQCNAHLVMWQLATCLRLCSASVQPGHCS